VSRFKFKVTCNTQKVLDKVREHRASHVALVAEAREGYRKRAIEALERRLVDLREGRTVSVSFPQLHVPEDRTAEYDTAIGMLASNEDAVVVLEADEYRNLMEDVWDWSPLFVHANAGYSEGTRLWGSEKKLDGFERVGSSR